ncbi:MAG: hypothetical protein HY020_23320 [Burkholderiales bacterium]|nr:hypothetical protein [Burkholderiales bacterium]
MKIADFFASFKSLWGAAAVAAGAGPLGLWIADLEPPWPSSSGKVAALFCAIAILISFFVGPAGRDAEDSKVSRQKARRRGARIAGIALLVLGALGVGAYLWAYGRFVVQDAIDRGGRVEIIRTVVGTELRPGMGDIGSATSLDLLRDGLYDPERVWTSESVNMVRQLLAASFVLSFVLLTFGAALLAQLEKEPAAPAPKP